MNFTVNEWNNQTDSFCCGLTTRKVQQFRALCARMRSRCCRSLSSIKSRTTVSTNEKWTRGKIASHVVTFFCLYSFFHAHRRFWKYLWVRDHWVKQFCTHTQRTHTLSTCVYMFISRIAVVQRKVSPSILYICLSEHQHTHTDRQARVWPYSKNGTSVNT